MANFRIEIDDLSCFFNFKNVELLQMPCPGVLIARGQVEIGGAVSDAGI